MQMRKPQVWLLEASPRNPSTGATITVRLAGGGQHAYRYFGAQWLAGLDRPPIASSRLGYGEDDGVPVWGLESAAQAMQLVWAGGDRVLTIAEHFWPGAAFTLRSGPDGGVDGDFTVRLTGKATDARVDNDGILSLALADPTAALAVPAVPDTFAGSGGAEGPVDLKDRLKRRAFGPVLNVDLWPLDPANNIWVATDPSRPLQGIPAVYDRGNAGTVGATIAWAGSVASTLAALAASSPPDGGFTRAPSVGAVKWWHSSPGLLTADLLGEIGAGYVDSAPQIAERIVASRTAITFATGHVATWAAARPGDAGILLDNAAETVSQALWRLLGPCTMWWHLDGDGKIALGEWSWGASAGSLTGGRVERTGTYRPMKKCTLGYRKNHRQMARGDIAAALLIADIEGAQDAIDDAIGATNSVNLYRVEAAGVTSSKVFAGAGAGSEVAFGHANGSLLASAPASDPVAHIILADNGVAVGDQISVSGEVSFSDTGSTMALRVRFTDAAGAQVGIQTLTGIAGSATWTKMQSPSLTVPAGAVALHVVNRTNGGTGTAGIRNVMVNRGPICAPYTPPTRGATSNVNRGAWSSASIVYSIGDEVLSQGSTWGAKVGHVSSGGNGPPALPTTENSNWILRSAKGDAGTSGTDGDPGYTLNVAGNVAKVAGQPASLNCAVTGSAWGNGSAYSSQVFVGGAALWFNTPNTHGSAEVFMIGLNDNPSSGTSYTDIDHALLFQYVGPGDYRVAVYENGTARTLLTGGSYRAWDGTNKYGITYDGRYVRYWEINGTTVTMLYQNDVGANKAFGLDVSAYARLSLSNIGFSPKGADGATPLLAVSTTPAIQIDADAAGTPKVPLPRTIVYDVTSAGTSVKTSATPSNVQVSNCTASISGKNVLLETITGVSGWVDVDWTYGGQTVRARTTYTVKADGAAGDVATVMNSAQLVASESYVQIGGTIAINASSTGKLKVSAWLQYVHPFTTGICVLQAKIQYYNGSSWVDVSGTETTGSSAYYEMTDLYSVVGELAIAAATQTGLTAGGAYQTRVLARRASGGRYPDWQSTQLYTERVT